MWLLWTNVGLALVGRRDKGKGHTQHISLPCTTKKAMLLLHTQKTVNNANLAESCIFRNIREAIENRIASGLRIGFASYNLSGLVVPKEEVVSVAIWTKYYYPTARELPLSLLLRLVMSLVSRFTKNKTPWINNHTKKVRRSRLRQPT